MAVVVGSVCNRHMADKIYNISILPSVAYLVNIAQCGILCETDYTKSFFIFLLYFSFFLWGSVYSADVIVY